MKRGVGIDSMDLNGLTAKQELSAGAVCNLLPRLLAMGLEGAAYTFTLKKTLADGVALCNRCVDKSQGEREALTVFGVCANNERDVHGLNMKNPGRAGAFSVTLWVSVVAASEYGDEMKQVNKDVENAQVQTHRCANVIGFATVNDSAGIEQNQTRHDHHNHRREGE